MGTVGCGCKSHPPDFDWEVAQLARAAVKNVFPILVAFSFAILIQDCFPLNKNICIITHILMRIER